MKGKNNQPGLFHSWHFELSGGLQLTDVSSFSTSSIGNAQNRWRYRQTRNYSGKWVEILGIQELIISGSSSPGWSSKGWVEPALWESPEPFPTSFPSVHSGILWLLLDDAGAFCPNRLLNQLRRRQSKPWGKSRQSPPSRKPERSIGKYSSLVLLSCPVSGWIFTGLEVELFRISEHCTFYWVSLQLLPKEGESQSGSQG